MEFNEIAATRVIAGKYWPKAVPVQYDYNAAEQEERTRKMANKKMRPGEARALLRAAAAAIAVADKLVEKYGEDGEDGSVIRFTKTFRPSRRHPDEPTPSESLMSVLGGPSWEPGSYTTTPGTVTFNYAAIRAGGLWFLTGGGSSTPQAAEWEDLLEWLDSGISVDSVEWLARGRAAAVTSHAEASAPASAPQEHHGATDRIDVQKENS